MEFKTIKIDEWKESPRIGKFGRFILSQPAWVWGIAVLAAFFVLIWPIIAAVLISGVIFVVLFTLLAVANWIGTTIRSFFDGGDGRKNVRVVGTENGV